MHRFIRSLKLAPVALLGVVALLGAASRSQAQSDSGTTATTTTGLRP